MIHTVLILLGLLATSTLAGEVRLIYPRLEAGQDTFRYPSGLDSSFVLGHVADFTPASRLKCNGHEISLTADGAFLAFLPLSEPGRETSAWTFTLIQEGTDTSVTRFPYEWQAPTGDPVWIPYSAPVWYEVATDNAHILAAVGGSYLLFPQSDTPIQIDAVADNLAQVIIAPGLKGVIEKRFLEQNPKSWQPQPTPLRIGNGLAQESRLTFEVNRAPLWRAEIEGSALILTIFDAVAAIDRIHFAGLARQVFHDVTWQQLPHGVELRIAVADSTWRGYQVAVSESQLVVILKFSEWKKQGLRGKRIVLDPGHGGSADGAVGPRGTKEKDVALRWAEILATELRKGGAEVGMTREADSTLGLYERIEFARQRNCDVFLSLHANALPDGENPALRHGCGIYYFQSLSRPLAACLQDAIVERTGLLDDGIFDANLAVVRPTEFPAALIESAFLMHPEEELLLRDDKFLRKLSQGVRSGLESYFRKARTR